MPRSRLELVLALASAITKLTDVSQNLAQKANASYTCFSRTTAVEHHKAVSHLWVRTLMYHARSASLTCPFT